MRASLPDEETQGEEWRLESNPFLTASCVSGLPETSGTQLSALASHLNLTRSQESFGARFIDTQED